MTDKKMMGQVFTPPIVTTLILNGIRYRENSILYKKILEPSFGDGAFLKEIVRRIVNEGIRKGLSEGAILEAAEDNVYGIELDECLFKETKASLNKMLCEYGFHPIPWRNLYLNDFLIHSFDVQFDYIAGNPPYIRIQNLNESMREHLKSYRFAKGSTDSYVLFFERAINLLKPDGKMGFITPNSYFRNHSQKLFRQYLAENNYIEGIIDFKDSPIFPQTSTYTAITFINKTKSADKFIYQEHDGVAPVFECIVSSKSLVQNFWTFTNQADSLFLSRLELRPHRLEDYLDIKFGIATNGDKVYTGIPYVIDDEFVRFNELIVERALLKPAYKDVVWDGKYMIFPYTWDNERERYEVIPEQELKEQYPLTYAYFTLHKELLLSRDMEKNNIWYEFGRRQGLNSCRDEKLVISRFVDVGKKTLEIVKLGPDTLVYSGIYMVKSGGEELDEMKTYMESEDFVRFCRLKGKDMKGSWKMVNAKIIKEFRFERG